MTTTLLNIKNLKVKVNTQSILEGLNLTINSGEVHTLMGPNGSGKSTLSYVLARHPNYKVTNGEIIYCGKNLLKFTTEQCAHEGIFLCFQYPVAIPGVSNIQFLKTSVNAVRKLQNLPLYDSVDFLAIVREKIALIGMPEELLYRSINDGFSGGEKKRNEILQMLLLEPKLAILDEVDSGLDIDALQAVAKGINHLRKQKKSILIITHYQRLLNYVEPDFIHVVSKGKIIHSGTKELANTLELEGYTWLSS